MYNSVSDTRVSSFTGALDSPLPDDFDFFAMIFLRDMLYEPNSTNHLPHTGLIFLILHKKAFTFAFLSIFPGVDGWKVLHFYKRDKLLSDVVS